MKILYKILISILSFISLLCMLPAVIVSAIGVGINYIGAKLEWVSKYPLIFTEWLTNKLL